MNRAANLLKAVAFVFSAFISAGIFGGFAAWAVSTLDPATQEVIGLVGSPPWLSVPTYPKVARTVRSVGDRSGESRRSAAPIAARP